MEDSAIVDLYWQRSERAIEESEQKYGAYCCTVAYNILSDSQDAEECVNDVWLGAWNAMPAARPARLGGLSLQNYPKPFVGSAQTPNPAQKGRRGCCFGRAS